MKTGILAACALASCGLASAHETHAHANWQSAGYVGGAAAYNHIDIGRGFDDGSLSGVQNDDADVGYRLFAGWSFLRHFGLELGYADYGEGSRTAQSDGSGVLDAGPVRQDVGLTTIDLSALARLPVREGLSAVLAAGVAHYEAKDSIAGSFGGSAFSQVDRNRGNSALFGARLEWQATTHVRLAVGYTRTTFDGQYAGDGTVQSLGLTAAYWL